MFQLPKDIRKIEPNYESVKELCKCMDIWEQLWNYNIPSIKYYIGEDLTSDEELETINTTKTELVKTSENAYFRTNLCRYLYRNAEQISNTLIEELLNKI